MARGRAAGRPAAASRRRTADRHGSSASTATRAARREPPAERRPRRRAGRRPPAPRAGGAGPASWRATSRGVDEQVAVGERARPAAYVGLVEVRATADARGRRAGCGRRARPGSTTRCAGSNPTCRWWSSRRVTRSPGRSVGRSGSQSSMDGFLPGSGPAPIRHPQAFRGRVRPTPCTGLDWSRTASNLCKSLRLGTKPQQRQPVEKRRRRRRPEGPRRRTVC